MVGPVCGESRAARDGGFRCAAKAAWRGTGGSCARRKPRGFRVGRCPAHGGVVYAHPVRGETLFLCCSAHGGWWVNLRVTVAQIGAQKRPPPDDWTVGAFASGKRFGAGNAGEKSCTLWGAIRVSDGTRKRGAHIRCAEAAAAKAARERDPRAG